MIKFTPKEESAILSCIANGIPICCDQNAGLRRLLVSSPAKARALATFSHENLACSGGSPDGSDFWDYQFRKVAGWLGSDLDDVGDDWSDP